MRALSITPASAASPARTASTDDLLNAFAVFVHLDVANGDASQDTVRGYFSQVKQYVEWCHQSGINPATADETDIKHYRQHVVDSGHGRGTIAHKLTVIRRFYSAAKERGYRPDNPVEHIKPPRDRSADDDIKYLSENELATLLGSVPRDGKPASLRDLALIAFLGLQARRQIEAHRANVEDIRSDGSMLVRGKYHDHIIQLRGDMLALFKRYINVRGHINPDAQGTPLFVAVGNRAGGTRLSRRGLRKIVDGYLACAGLKRDGLSGHALRHTGATAMYANTQDLRAVQDALGHRDPRTTSRYAHIVDRRANNPAERIKVRI